MRKSRGKHSEAVLVIFDVSISLLIKKRLIAGVGELRKKCLSREVLSGGWPSYQVPEGGKEGELYLLLG
jgi:hypothetical protein